MTTPRPSALPSVKARILAFSAILVAGIASAMIGWGIVNVQCQGSCSTAKGVGAIVGGVIGAVGVGVVAVLVLRAMGEWGRILQERNDADRP